jgi:osmotically-inducible protein OsmY
MSFRRHGEIFSEGTRAKGQKRPESRSRPNVGMSFRLAIPWPVALQQSRPPLRQLRASVHQRSLGVEKFSVNGTLSLNCLSHLRGQAQTIAVLGLSLTTVLATAPNFYLAAVKEPKDTKPKVQTERDTSQERRRLEREVRHELVTLPYYDVFDNLEYRVDGSQVTLSGQVVRPTLKSGAENVVKNIEGVEKVTNNIEVLPLSPNDDGIRVAVYRAIYGHTALQRYSVRSVPPIHIIVRNGNVTLEGVVANEGDKNIANIQANGVSGVFSVTNNLRVDQ